jgi:endoglucanase
MRAKLLCAAFPLLGALAASAAAGPQTVGENQAGYLSGESKDFRVASAAPGFEILSAGGTVVFRGSLRGPLADPFAGENVWVGSFAELRTPGTYTIRLPDGTVSWPFAIGQEVYRHALRAAITGLYASRCGHAVREPSVAHPPCHKNDGQFILQNGKKIPDARDVKGAWHNGGDYRRSTMSAAQAISRILWPLELYPAAYDGIPATLATDERWGTQPDALAEAKWGLEWLMKMQFADGGISIGLGPELNTMPGQIPPHTDTLPNFIGAAYTAHTAKAGAVFAKAARLLRDREPDFTSRCLERALACWGFLEKHPVVVAPRTCATYGKREDAPDRLWIAVELFRTTGEDQYHAAFKKAFAALESPYPAAPISTQTIRDYNLHEALISYCFLAAKADVDIRRKILQGLKADCDRMVRSATARGYGNALEEANWRQRHTSGNVLQMAWELAMASELTGDTAYRRAALDQLHFILGRNPLGKVLATGIGSNPVRDPHYRPSHGKTPPPGLLVKGPTLDPQFHAKAIKLRFKNPPPAMKSYLDQWSSHWCNEPDVEVQGHFIGMLAWADASHLARTRQGVK